jgi:Putative transposase
MPVASLNGFTLRAATRPGALHGAGREALLRYVLRPSIAQQRLERAHSDVMRITLKRAYADGTLAVELDPVSLLCRVATSVPPRFQELRRKSAPAGHALTACHASSPPHALAGGRRTP